MPRPLPNQNLVLVPLTYKCTARRVSWHYCTTKYSNYIFSGPNQIVVGVNDFNEIKSKRHVLLSSSLLFLPFSTLITFFLFFFFKFCRCTFIKDKISMTPTAVKESESLVWTHCSCLKKANVFLSMWRVAIVSVSSHVGGQ